MSFLCSTTLSSRGHVAQTSNIFNRAQTSTMRVNPRPLTIAMAKATKAAEFRGLSNDQIDEKVQELRIEMFNSRIKYAKREDYKPAQYKEMRKQVARLLTIKREREIEQGVGKRDSRAAEKRRNVEAGLGQF